MKQVPCSVAQTKTYKSDRVWHTKSPGIFEVQSRWIEKNENNNKHPDSWAVSFDKKYTDLTNNLYAIIQNNTPVSRWLSIGLPIYTIETNTSKQSAFRELFLEIILVQFTQLETEVDVKNILELLRLDVLLVSVHFVRNLFC